MIFISQNTYCVTLCGISSRISVLGPFVENKILHSVHLGAFFWPCVLLMVMGRWLTALDCRSRFHFPWSQLIIRPPAESFSIVIYQGLFPVFRLELREKRQMIPCLLERKQQQCFLLDERRRLFNWVGTLVCIVYQENDHASRWWLFGMGSFCYQGFARLEFCSKFCLKEISFLWLSFCMIIKTDTVMEIFFIRRQRHVYRHGAFSIENVNFLGRRYEWSLYCDCADGGGGSSSGGLTMTLVIMLHPIATLCICNISELM